MGKVCSEGYDDDDDDIYNDDDNDNNMLLVYHCTTVPLYHCNLKSLK